MAEQQVEVKIKPGLQARQAALFVQEANRFESDIFLQKDERKVNAKSIMGIKAIRWHNDYTHAKAWTSQHSHHSHQLLAMKINKEKPTSL